MTKPLGLGPLGHVSLFAIAMLSLAASGRAEQPGPESTEAASLTSPGAWEQPASWSWQQPGSPSSQSSSSQPPSSSAPSQTPTDPEGQKAKAEVRQTGTSNDRLFFALPNFLTVENSGQVPPLTAGQKFKTVLRSSFDPVQIPWYGALAGISQAENSEPGYGQGAEGYAKRFGAAAADGTIENFWVSAILPSLLHQDPRFFQKSTGNFWHRAGYAVSRIFIIRSDSGKSEFNASEIFGSAIAAGISTYSYHPHADKTLANTADVWGTQLGYDTITIVLKEFWPDIRRKFSHKNNAP